uniref:Uncharacterized protein n=1 Tax=Nelumbo nucifera TaxID=4432 RepID=A0A822ZLE3_NELNU|nr:TPA_asm: hypothetical protein HUJ06_003530 [Nelumbo nucifera]
MLEAMLFIYFLFFMLCLTAYGITIFICPDKCNCLLYETSLSCCGILIGVYELVPYYKGENRVFDVLPPTMLVFVGRHHIIVPQKFLVVGLFVALCS